MARMVRRAGLSAERRFALAEYATRVLVSTHRVHPHSAATGYQHKLPYTEVEVADIWTINSWIRKHEIARLTREAKPFFGGCVDACS